MNLSSSSAIVTGGGSGLGEATARALADAGVAVTVVDIDEQGGARVAAEIGGAYARADVADSADVAVAIDLAIEHAPLRVAVNCAGIPSLERTVGSDGRYDSAHNLDRFRRVVEVNLIGTFNVTRLAATAMSQNDPDPDGCRGVILNTSSVAAFEGQVGQVAYSASKGGVVGLTLPLARDLASVGVRVNTLAPGLIETPIYGEGPDAEQFKAHLAKDVVFPRRLGRAEEFADLAVAIITNAYVNGETIRVDGGVRLPRK